MKNNGFLGLLIIAATTIACSTPIAYQPSEGVLDGMSRDQREQLFAETLSRARKPPMDFKVEC